jgi:diguanylate cyclase (GGDEF)-like protein
MKRLRTLLRKTRITLRMDVPEEYIPDFKREILSDNFSRLCVVSVALFLIELPLLYLQQHFFQSGYVIFAFLAVSFVFIPLIFYVRKHVETVGHAFGLVVLYIYALVVLILGAALALCVIKEADLTHVYLMAVLGMAMFFYVRPVPLAVLYAAVYAGFAVALPYVGAAPESLLVLRINTLIFNLFAWLLGVMSMRSRISVFISRRQLHEQNMMLKDLAQRDAMTGLFHHAAALRLLESEIRRARDTGLPLSLIMADIDNFKMINDTYGHQFGDDVILRVASAFDDVFRGTGIVGRYGGEEFIVILPGAHLEQARMFAKNVQSKLKNTMSHPEVTLSGGISLYSGESLDAFIRLTDEKLYRAKSQGKHRFVSD